MTNADKIRALSEREIAAVLHEDYCISSFGGTAEERTSGYNRR